MAIAGSLLKQAARIVGKAIKVTKKKKGQVGGKLKKQFKKEADFIDSKIVKPAKDRVSTLKKSLQSQKVKGMPLVKVKGGEKVNPDLLKRFQKKVQAKTLYTGTKAKASQVADAALNTQAFTKGAKAIKATASKAIKEVQSIVGDNVPEAAGFITGGLAAAGAFALTSSLIKSNTSPEQLYDQSRLPDGRFSTTFKGGNSNVVFSNSQLSTNDVDKVRTSLAILDSIIASDDPQSSKKEFLTHVLYLADRFGISNISGKNLSILVPTNFHKGRQPIKRTGIKKALLGDPSTNKNIQAAQKFYDEMKKDKLPKITGI